MDGFGSESDVQEGCFVDETEDPTARDCRRRAVWSPGLAVRIVLARGAAAGG
jgi:hypothetical protein